MGRLTEEEARARSDADGVVYRSPETEEDRLDVEAVRQWRKAQRAGEKPVTYESVRRMLGMAGVPPAPAPPPVDRTARCVVGEAVAPGVPDTTTKPGGQQRGYSILCDEERAKGFVRPVRRSYIHDKCGVVTTMGRELAETYARDPSYYSGTFCVHCGEHYPVGAGGEFTWDDGSGAKVGT